MSNTTLKFMPEGEIEPGIKFSYGCICGSQKTPSIALSRPMKLQDGKTILAGGVMTHKQVDDLIDFLIKQRKKWSCKLA